MSLLEDELRALQPKPKQQGCKTCYFLAGESESVRTLVDDWILGNNRNNSTKALHDVLAKHGYPYSISGLKCHIEHVRKTRDA